MLKIVYSGTPGCRCYKVNRRIPKMYIVVKLMDTFPECWQEVYASDQMWRCKKYLEKHA